MPGRARESKSNSNAKSYARYCVRVGFQPGDQGVAELRELEFTEFESNGEKLKQGRLRNESTEF